MIKSAPVKLQHLTFEDLRGRFTPIDLTGRKWNQVNVVTNPKKSTLRGIHYQTAPPQTKYVKVVEGQILDILYDLTTGETFSILLNSEEGLLVDSNFAHGYLTLEDNTIVTYLVEGEYNPNSERSIVWSTIPEIKEAVLKYCKEQEIIISDKDKNGK